MCWVIQRNRLTTHMVKRLRAYCKLVKLNAQAGQPPNLFRRHSYHNVLEATETKQKRFLAGLSHDC